MELREWLPFLTVFAMPVGLALKTVFIYLVFGSLYKSILRIFIIFVFEVILLSVLMASLYSRHPYLVAALYSVLAFYPNLSLIKFQNKHRAWGWVQKIPRSADVLLTLAIVILGNPTLACLCVVRFVGLFV